MYDVIHLYDVINLKMLVKISKKCFLHKEQTLRKKKIYNYDFFHFYFIGKVSVDFKCTQHEVENVDYLKKFCPIS